MPSELVHKALKMGTERSVSPRDISVGGTIFKADRVRSGREQRAACPHFYLSRNAILLFAISLFALASCRHRQARVFVPPPSKLRPFVLPPEPQLPEPPELDVQSEAEYPPELISPIPVLPPPPAPPRRPPVVATPRPTPSPVPSEPPSSPRLGQIFTADQLREYNRTLDESLARVRRVLAVAAGRKLTGQQAGMVVRIRTFLMQAEQTRQQDLVTALSLARRADLLAQDLAGSLP